MTCRHSPGDPNCSSSDSYQRRIAAANIAESTPDPKNYKITKFTRVGPHVILSVQYPSCKRCTYEGNKVMVFLNAPEEQVVQWRQIDPHFRDEKPASNQAPGPDARFPASEAGWEDALNYARSKTDTSSDR